jgi:HSP20 family protein
MIEFDKKNSRKEENKMTLVKWTPMRSLISLPEEIDRFFTGFGLGWKDFDSVWSPSVDLSETEDSYEVKAEVPGMNKDEIKISYHDNVLTLSGERKQEEKTDKKNYHRIERAYGRFERSFRLPEEVKAEEIKAKYKNGVLSIEIPKAEKVKPKEIEVS